MRQIDHVSYSIISGTILPELQYSEEFIIRGNEVTFIRKNNSENTHVNTGTWSVTVDKEKINLLFNTLEKVRCNDLVRHELEDTSDGGSTEVFTIYYKNNHSCQIYLAPGVYFDNGDRLLLPIQSFIKELVLPEDALSKISN